MLTLALNTAEVEGIVISHAGICLFKIKRHDVSLNASRVFIYSVVLS